MPKACNIAATRHRNLRMDQQGRRRTGAITISVEASGEALSAIPHHSYFSAENDAMGHSRRFGLSGPMSAGTPKATRRRLWTTIAALVAVIMLVFAWIKVAD